MFKPYGQKVIVEYKDTFCFVNLTQKLFTILEPFNEELARSSESPGKNGEPFNVFTTSLTKGLLLNDQSKTLL